MAERSPALLRLASLLASDRGSAEGLVQMALVRTFLRWRRFSADRGRCTACSGDRGGIRKLRPVRTEPEVLESIEV